MSRKREEKKKESKGKGENLRKEYKYSFGHMNKISKMKDLKTVP